jgi:hypothetical protein
MHWLWSASVLGALMLGVNIGIGVMAMLIGRDLDQDHSCNQGIGEQRNRELARGERCATVSGSLVTSSTRSCITVASVDKVVQRKSS